MPPRQARGQPLHPIYALGSLLSVAATDRFSLLPMTRERQKRRTLETPIDLVRAMTAERPFLLLVEDLHWIDPATLELLTLLFDRTSTVPIFAVLTTRPSFQAPWTARAHVGTLTLNRLSHRQTAAMTE